MQWVLSRGGLLSFLPVVDGEEKVIYCSLFVPMILLSRCGVSWPISDSLASSCGPNCFGPLTTVTLSSNVTTAPPASRHLAQHDKTGFFFSSSTSRYSEQKTQRFLLQCCEHKGTKIAVTDWSQSWRHCVYVLFALPPACVKSGALQWKQSCLFDNCCGFTKRVLRATVNKHPTEWGRGEALVLAYIWQTGWAGERLPL